MMNINKDRLAAFTDAIAAIAATIMVLNLGVPENGDWSGFLSQTNVLFTYIVSYMMIYFAWYMHHNLFAKADAISVRAFLVNGIWLLFLTLVPFTTAWVGKAGKSTAPQILYSLNMLLWVLTYYWLEYLVKKDNPGVSWDDLPRSADRMILSGGLVICFALSFLLLGSVVPLTGMIVVILIVRSFKAAGKKRQSRQERKTK